MKIVPKFGALVTSTESIDRGASGQQMQAAHTTQKVGEAAGVGTAPRFRVKLAYPRQMMRPQQMQTAPRMPMMQQQMGGMGGSFGHSMVVRPAVSGCRSLVICTKVQVCRWIPA